MFVLHAAAYFKNSSSANDKHFRDWETLLGLKGSWKKALDEVRQNIEQVQLLVGKNPILE